MGRFLFAYSCLEEKIMKSRSLLPLLLLTPLCLCGCDLKWFDDNWRCTPEEFFSSEKIDPTKRKTPLPFAAPNSSRLYLYVLEAASDSSGTPSWGRIYVQSFDDKAILYHALKACSYTPISTWSAAEDTTPTSLLNYGASTEDYYYGLQLRSDGDLLINYVYGDIFPDTGCHYYHINASDLKNVTNAIATAQIGQVYTDLAAFQAAKGLPKVQMFASAFTQKNLGGGLESAAISLFGQPDHQTPSVTHPGHYLYYDCGETDLGQKNLTISFALYASANDSETSRIKGVLLTNGDSDWFNPEDFYY